MTPNELKYAVRYPISGIRTCPYGLEQAQLIQFLAWREGIDAKIATSHDGQVWVW